MKAICRTLFLATLTLVSCSCAFAEGVDEQNRFDSFMMEGVLHRFDKRTGALEKLQRGADGLRWIDVDVRQSNAAPVKSAEARSSKPAPDSPENKAKGENAQIGEKRKPAPIVIEDENGLDITDLVTEYDRRQSMPDVSAYEKKISLSHTVQIGDRITGNILVRNLGDRRLKILELTMIVPVIGKEKPEEHRFLFLEKAGYISAPQPGAPGKEAEALLQKVDLPCPAGGVKGSPELKISHIKYAD